MMQEVKQERRVIDGYKDFVRRFKRIPSIRELGIHIGWKKSVTNKWIERLIGKGVFKKEDGISKSLTLVEK